MRYLTCAETAKLIRGQLKAKFPSIKFSVRSKTYSGGASIQVEWVNGPSRKTIRTILDSHDTAGADYIFDNRDYSPEVMEKTAIELCEYYGLPKEWAEYSRLQSRNDWVENQRRTLSEVVVRRLDNIDLMPEIKQQTIKEN